jgi:hypothetical protein
MLPCRRKLARDIDRQSRASQRDTGTQAPIDRALLIEPWCGALLSPDRFERGPSDRPPPPLGAPELAGWVADWLADTDAASLRAQLAGGAASSPQRVDVASRLATRFVTPLAPVGIHATIRGRCPPLELLRREWTFHITGLTSFVHPKLGEPSQWDPSWFCARWYALELCWDGPADDAAQGRAAERGGASRYDSLSNAQLCRGSWPHIAIGCAGVRCRPRPSPPRSDAGTVGRAAATATGGHRARSESEVSSREQMAGTSRQLVGSDLECREDGGGSGAVKSTRRRPKRQKND